MNSLSTKSIQNSIIKRIKVHRAQPIVARKIIAFEELINLKKRKKSSREAAELLEIPNSTMQSWRKRSSSSKKVSPELEEFLSTPAGADFLQRDIMAVMKLMKCGPGGIHGMQEYLLNTGLDSFVASSAGTLQNFWVRCENHIIEFGKCEESRLTCRNEV